MILDNSLILDTAATTTSSGVSANTIDLQNARDMGIGDSSGATPKLMVLVTTAYATTNAGTLTIKFEGSTDNSAWDVYAATRAMTASEMAVGRRLFDIDVPRPGPGNSLPRYLRLEYVVANAFTGGALTAAIVLGRQDNAPPNYPAGIAIAN